ncbi:MAG: chemotaxis protein CheD [Oscillospiraceae bacterium]|jgi:chemotaxis protein CheD|nr:chemotaxis protein CheD [Oscillospiraceae bacterium]
MTGALNVGISDWKVNKGSGIIVTYALGSCVGICLYDKAALIGGLSHIMLPDSKGVAAGASTNRMKFADTAIPDMLSKMLTMGAVKARITAKIAGGAQMFVTSSEKFNIGDRNVAAVKDALRALNIPIVAHDVGLNFGRTVFFHTDDGKIIVKSSAKGEKIL